MTTIQDILSHTYEYYQWLHSLADNRTKGWFLVDCLSSTLFCIFFYLFVTWTGPKFMKTKKPKKLTWVLIPYNFAMAALNLHIAYKLFAAVTRLKYSYSCEPSNKGNHPDELQVADAFWCFFISKLLEFGDTFFFIFRKKDQQLTFLHVYHHVTIFFFSWIGIKWFPGGSISFPMMINSSVHVVMYIYYGLSAFGPHVTKYLWWKKYLTILQLVQFMIIILLILNVHINGCNFPLWTYYVGVVYMISFIVLFGNFYKKSYVKRGKQILFNLDIGCGQGNVYADKTDYSFTNNRNVGVKTE